MDARRRFIEILSKFWWVIVLLVVGGAILTKVAIFKYIVFVIAIPFLIFLFLPFLIQFFAPAFYLIWSLIDHFQHTQAMPALKRYIFIPMALVSIVLFIIAQTILSIWVFVISFLAWGGIIGTFFAIFFIFFFGLAPLAIITAPFVVWAKVGFPAFINTAIFFLMAAFWYGLSNLAFSEDYFSSSPENYLGYSPQTFLLGALSTQAIAMPFYFLQAPATGSAIADIGGIIFLILTGISAIKWQLLKLKLSVSERLTLYKPSVWSYILGLITTDCIYSIFYKYNANTVVLMWLNTFFILALISRFISFLRHGVRKEQEV